MRRELGEVLRRRVRVETRPPVKVASPTFGSAASGSAVADISSSASSAASRPLPWFAPNAATSSERSRSAASRALTPASVSAPSSKLISATIGSAETPRTASIASSSSSRS